jgi:hypothetical protein
MLPESSLELIAMARKRPTYGNVLWSSIVAVLFGSLCGLPVILRAHSTQRTFTSPDRVFKFQYSPALVHCSSQKSEEGYTGSWFPAAACSSQQGVCDDAASSATTIACFAYPKDDFKDKPTFTAAAFFVAEVRAATTPGACLKGSPNWIVLSSQSTRINSIRGKLFRITSEWMSGGQDGEIYRVFHGKRCYECGIQEATSSPAAYDPGTIKEFTERDSAEVRARLKQALNSFAFLK